METKLDFLVELDEVEYEEYINNRAAIVIRVDEQGDYLYYVDYD